VKLAGTYRIETLDVMDDSALARALQSLPDGPLCRIAWRSDPHFDAETAPP